MNTDIEWRAVIDTTLANFKGAAVRPVYDDYLAVAKRLFPVQMAAHGSNFERQGFIKALKSAMNHLTDLTEQVEQEEGEAPLQLKLDLIPGAPAPRYVNIGTMKVPDILPYLEQTVEQAERVQKKRKDVRARVSFRIEDEDLKIKFFKKHRLHASEKYVDILTRLEKEKKEKENRSKPSEGDVDGLSPEPA